MKGRKLWTWGLILSKRKLHSASFWIVFALFFIVVALIKNVKDEPLSGTLAVLSFEETIEEEENAFRRDFLQELLQTEHTDFIRYRVAGDEEEVRKLVATGEAECGYLFPKDMGKRMNQGKTRGSIVVITSPQSTYEPVVSEQLYAVLFRLSSAELFVEYVEQHPELAANRAEALKAFSTRVVDGSTFGFTYETVHTKESGDESGKAAAQAGVLTGVSTLPRVQVIAALFLYLLVCTGVYDLMGDRVQMYYYFAGDRISQFLAGAMEIAIPYGFVVLLMSLFHLFDVRAGLICLPFLVLYGWVLAGVFRKRVVFVSAVPLFLLGTLLICPIFVDLAVYVPMFRPLQWCFPVTWLLHW